MFVNRSTIDALLQILYLILEIRLGNPKAAAHVGVRPSVHAGHCKVLYIITIITITAMLHAKLMVTYFADKKDNRNESREQPLQ